MVVQLRKWFNALFAFWCAIIFHPLLHFVVPCTIERRPLKGFMCIPAQAKEQEYEHYDMVIEISFESIRERLTAGLESRLQDVDGDPSKQFAPRNLARDVLNGDHDRLEHLFIAAQHLARIPNLVNPIAHCSATSFVALLSRNDHRSVHRIFATLLCMHMSRGLFRRFLLIFLPENETAEDTICDTHLPIDLTTAIRLFEEDGRQFYHKQFVWSPIILLEHQRVEYIDNRRFCPLPRLSKKPIGSGSFGDVSKVELAEGSIEFGTGISFQRCFAQKEFVVAQNSRHAFEDEWHVVREILRANKRHRNIMSPIAGLLHGEEADMKFSIFFPVATCNLREYLKAESPRLSANPYPLGGFNVREKKGILYQAISLVDGLDHLHYGLNAEDDHSFSCWHLDPQSAERTSNPERNRQWHQRSISDLRLRHLKGKANTASPRGRTSAELQRQQSIPTETVGISNRGASGRCFRMSGA